VVIQSDQNIAESGRAFCQKLAIFRWTAQVCVVNNVVGNNVGQGYCILGSAHRALVCPRDTDVQDCTAATWTHHGAGCAQESKPSVLAATSSRWPFSERHPAQTKTLGFDMGALGPSVQDHTKWCTALHGPPAPWLKKPFPPSPLFPHNCFTLCTPCTLAHEAL
jgi:hypothetical protein